MSAALELGLDQLTETERRLFDALYERLGQWVPRPWLSNLVIGTRCYDNRFHTHLSRLRAKLARTPWRIERSRSYGAYRLVEDTAPVPRRGRKE